MSRSSNGTRRRAVGALALAVSSALALAGALLLSPAAAQRDWSQVQVESEQVAGGVHLLRGAGGNIGLSAGPDGVLLIDAQYAQIHDKVVAAARRISDRPIRFVVNTHWHGDHVGGNESLRAAGAVIVAHENVRARMSADQVSGVFNRTVPASPPGALPMLTFSDSLTFHWSGDEVLVFHLAPGHTDGDAVVWFKKANVIHAGDCFFNGIYPVIDISAGGSVDGLIAQVDRILSLGDDSTRIIPGHGPLARKPEYRAFRDMLAAVRERVDRQIAAGKTKDEVLAARPTAEFDERWGKGFMKPEVFAGVVYESLMRKQAE